MLYWMPNLMFPDSLMSAMASVRDQTTLQLIASNTLQHDLQSGMDKSFELGISILDDCVEPFATGEWPPERHH